MSKVWLIGGGAFFVILLVVSIIVALLDLEEPLTPGTPEATVQQFLKAAEAEDLSTAFDSLSSKLQEDCRQNRPRGLAWTICIEWPKNCHRNVK